MKKITAVLLSVLLTLSLTGCLFGGAQPQEESLTNDGTASADGSSAEGSGSHAVTPETSPAATGATETVPQGSTSSGITPQTTAAPAGPALSESTTAEPNSQIMTATAPVTEAQAHKLLSAVNWADTVWTDSEDLCHLRITDLTDTGISFYWHSRVDRYPASFQSKLCTAAFNDDVISCNYEDDGGNTGVIKLTVRDQSISFDQTIVHSGYYSPTALKLTLLPKASGTDPLYFEGSRADILGARNQLCLNAGGSSLQGAVNDYVENVLGITDVSANSDYLLETHTRFYTESELSGYSKDLIRIFKNEIYARHGYRFNTPEVYNLFIRFTWYYPDLSSDNFKESVFNQYEKENLKLLVKLEEK